MKENEKVIGIIGIGNAGCNLVTYCKEEKTKGAKTIAINNGKDLKYAKADKKIFFNQYFKKKSKKSSYRILDITKEKLVEIKESLKGLSLVFICAGLGGRTGTELAPLIATVAKMNKCTIIGAVMMPFHIERERVKKAKFGLDQLRQICDTVIVVDNNILTQKTPNLPISRAFSRINNILTITIKNIIESISIPCLVNFNLGDIKEIINDSSIGTVSIAQAKGKNRVKDIVQNSFSNLLYKINIKRISGVLLTLNSGPSLTLDEVNEIGSLFTNNFKKNTNIMWSAKIQDNFPNNKIKASLCLFE